MARKEHQCRACIYEVLEMKSRYGFHLMCYIRSNIFISSLKGGQVDSYDTSCTICIVLLSPPSFKKTDSATGSAIFPKSVVSQPHKCYSVCLSSRQHLTRQ